MQEKRGWLEKLAAAEAEAERYRGEAQQLRLRLLPSSADEQVGAGFSATGHRQEHEMNKRHCTARGTVGAICHWPVSRPWLRKQVLQAVAAEAALRSLLLEARQELIAACRALSGELHRVHKLEELRIRESCRGRDAEHCTRRGLPAGRSAVPQIVRASDWSTTHCSKCPPCLLWPAGDVAEVRRLNMRLHEARQDCHKLAKSLAAAQQQLVVRGKRLERLDGRLGAAAAGSNPGSAGGDWRIAALGSSRVE